jgi:hypothetical protein
LVVNKIPLSESPLLHVAVAALESLVAIGGRLKKNKKPTKDIILKTFNCSYFL